MGRNAQPSIYKENISKIINRVDVQIKRGNNIRTQQMTPILENFINKV